MYKQSPTSRNLRSKGFKTKHVLQICLLVAVCFWLIYQVKRSHEKGKEFDENDDSSFPLKTTMLGRKDLLPRSEGITLTNKEDKPVEDDNPEEDVENKPEEEESEEDVENKPEEEESEQDQDNKFEDEDDRGGGDDEVDEDNQEVKHEDEVVDMNNSEEDENSRDHELDEDSGNTHEAQEVLYKADDASSAVTHDTQENEKVNLEDANENAEVRLFNKSLLKLDDHETTTGSNSSLNATNHEESIPEHVSSDSKNTSSVNLTSVVESKNHLEVKNLTEASGKDSKLPQSSFDSTIDGNANMNESAGGEDSKLTSVKNEELNSTSVNSSIASTHTAPVSENASQEHHIFDHEAEISGTNDETGGIDERLESSNTENLGETGQDLIDHSDTSIPLEEKERGTDMETLPEIQTEGSNTEDAAAE